MKPITLHCVCVCARGLPHLRTASLSAMHGSPFRFKGNRADFNVLFVLAMWLTGFIQGLLCNNAFKIL